MEIYDLSMPIEEHHFRWPVEQTKKGNFKEADVFEVTTLKTSCHAFTHIDAPCHMVPGGKMIHDLDLSKVVGKTAVINLSVIQPNEEISARHLEDTAGHLEDGQIALFKTCWDQHRDWRTEDYWQNAPYISASACHWLLKKRPTAVAFDFPQDHSIRRVMNGEPMPPIEQHVSHDILLRNGVTLIEYLIGTAQLQNKYTHLSALPLKLPKSDGSPARVVAWDYPCS